MILSMLGSFFQHEILEFHCIGTSAHAVGKIETIDAIQVADGLLHGSNPGKIS